MLDNRRIFVQMNYYNDYELRERKVINVLLQENTYQNGPMRKIIKLSIVCNYNKKKKVKAKSFLNWLIY